MRFSPKEAWQSTQILAGDFTSYHNQPNRIQLRLPNNSLATTVDETKSVMAPHLAGVFQKYWPVDWEVLNKVQQRRVIDNLDDPIS